MYCAKKLDEHKAERIEHHWVIVEGGEDSSVVGGGGYEAVNTTAQFQGGGGGGGGYGRPDGESIIATLRSVLAARAGGFSALKDLAKQFKLMDRTKNGHLDREEVARGLTVFLRGFGMRFSAAETDELFAYLDVDRSGSVDYNEFVRQIIGDMNERRVALVDLAYGVLDPARSGAVTLADIASKYDVSQNPKVLSGEWTKDRALREFVKEWDRNGDAVITREEFREYYSWVSPSIDNDDHFELMIRNAWHISGGSGWSENTANRRVLATFANGRQQVLEIKNDLGIGPKDTAKMIERLRQQGYEGIVKVQIAE